MCYDFKTQVLWSKVKPWIGLITRELNEVLSTMYLLYILHYVKNERSGLNIFYFSFLIFFWIYFPLFYF